MHPKYKTKYHVGNWPAYERALVRRGDVTLWLSADAMDGWTPPPSGQPGGPRKFSDLSIETALTLRLVFRLPLRQTEGFLRSVLALMRTDPEAPDHTTLGQSWKNAPLESSMTTLLFPPSAIRINCSSGLNDTPVGTLNPRC